MAPSYAHPAFLIMETEEIWKDIEETGGDYQVSNLGRVRSKERVIVRSNGWAYTRISKILKPATDARGYYRVAFSLKGKLVTRKVHRLVAQAFIANPFKKVTVNHIDGNKKNNTVENLEWMSFRENSDHAEKTGLVKHAKGEGCGKACILKEYQVLEMRRRYDPKGCTYSDLGREFGVSKDTVRKIVRRELWKHI